MNGTPFSPKLWLAPLTFGGNLPFRRLCVESGAEITVGEMAVVKRLLQGRSTELALLRRHPDEPFFGAQLADKKPETLAEGARLAESRGARFVDLNCGCPTRLITGRGLGAALLRKVTRLGRLVETMVRAVEIPVTVKLRTGWSADRQNVAEVARVCEQSGASAITIHARSREQRYSRAADWELIGRVAAERGVPVIGNGDILTHYEARERMKISGVGAVMLGRGALIKPWLFREIREGRDIEIGAVERVGMLWRFVELLRDHFGIDERGAARARRFLAWHLGFFCRYRPLPEAEFSEQARLHPLLQTRLPDWPEGSRLELLLRDSRQVTHERIADALIGSTEPAQALERLGLLAETIEPERVVQELSIPENQVTG